MVITTNTHRAEQYTHTDHQTDQSLSHVHGWPISAMTLYLIMLTRVSITWLKRSYRLDLWNLFHKHISLHYLWYSQQARWSLIAHPSGLVIIKALDRVHQLLRSSSTSTSHLVRVSILYTYINTSYLSYQTYEPPWTSLIWSYTQEDYWDEHESHNHVQPGR